MALRNFVNGVQVDAKDGRTSDVVDPSTGEPYEQAPLSGAADVDAAMTAAAAAFEEWRDATPGERSLAMLRVADAVEAKAEELVQAECRNTGKPLQLTRDEEIGPMVDEFRFFAGCARLLEGRSAGSTWPTTPPWSGASRSACARRSRRGTTRWSWPPGRSRRPWRRATRSC